MDLREISCDANYIYTELAQVRIQGWASALRGVESGIPIKDSHFNTLILSQ
jgi:hypothetical protein